MPKCFLQIENAYYNTILISIFSIVYKMFRKILVFTPSSCVFYGKLLYDNDR